MAGLPLSQAIEEYLAWLELDRHASTGTVAGYRGDLRRFSDFASGDAGIPDIAELDRDILRGYQRHLARGPDQQLPTRPRTAAAHHQRLAAVGGLTSTPVAAPAPSPVERASDRSVARLLTHPLQLR